MNNISVDETWTHLFIIVEAESGHLTQTSKELLGKGRELADQLGVWLMAYPQPFPSDGAREIISYGADIVFHAPPSSGASLADRLLDQKTRLIHLIETKRPEIVLFPANAQTVPMAARVAQHFRTGLVTGCTMLNLDLTERRLLATRPLFDGKLFEEYTWPTRRPQMATVAAGAFPEGFSDPYREGQVEEIAPLDW
jgi:electron transfer flavoprotein alpha subunit